MNILLAGFLLCGVDFYACLIKVWQLLLVTFWTSLLLRGPSLAPGVARLLCPVRISLRELSGIRAFLVWHFEKRAKQQSQPRQKANSTYYLCSYLNMI